MCVCVYRRTRAHAGEASPAEIIKEKCVHTLPAYSRYSGRVHLLSCSLSLRWILRNMRTEAAQGARRIGLRKVYYSERNRAERKEEDKYSGREQDIGILWKRMRCCRLFIISSKLCTRFESPICNTLYVERAIRNERGPNAKENAKHWPRLSMHANASQSYTQACICSMYFFEGRVPLTGNWMRAWHDSVVQPCYCRKRETLPPAEQVVQRSHPVRQRASYSLFPIPRSIAFTQLASVALTGRCALRTDTANRPEHKDRKTISVLFQKRIKLLKRCPSIILPFRGLNSVSSRCLSRLTGFFVQH